MEALRIVRGLSHNRKYVYNPLFICFTLFFMCCKKKKKKKCAFFQTLLDEIELYLMTDKEKTKSSVAPFYSYLFNYVSMHILKNIITIYSKSIFIPKGTGYIIHDRGVATLGHVTNGTSPP